MQQKELPSSPDILQQSDRTHEPADDGKGAHEDDQGWPLSCDPNRPETEEDGIRAEAIRRSMVRHRFGRQFST